ncbi:hypothetical protein DPMN_145177 [Dreissena polymorpha]|uniref:Uncharacterized protein n=1 Tax=Dreissena polymorpha TaxID=45954 RepID=A0A9D4J0Z2_DREPO|nr:hypothetical protein DPMN_145177 [Dreissena polymorpha]
MRCRHNNTDENGDLMDEIVNSIPDSTNTTMESTATSAMSLLEEEMEVDHAFDITRTERELPSERSISTSQLLDLCSAMYGPV